MAKRQEVDPQLAIAEFLHTTYTAISRDVADTWRKITAGALACLPDVDHASILLIDPRGTVRPFASTDRDVALLDEVQRQYLEGPALDAARNQAAAFIDDLAAETRWPTFIANTMSTAVRTLSAFPLFAHDGTCGALTLCSDRPAAFVDEARSECMAFALAAAVLADAAHREKRFHHVLSSREQVGQAQGMLMERFGLDPMSAHSMLLRMAEQHREPVAVVARKLLSAGRARSR
jgi:transcriptional regulator with GAF, ATPase, and Fis domain